MSASTPILSSPRIGLWESNSATKIGTGTISGAPLRIAQSGPSARTSTKHKNPPKIPQKQLQNPPFPKLLRQRGPSRASPSVPIEAPYAHVQKSQSPSPPMHENARGCTVFSNRRLPQRRAPNPAKPCQTTPSSATVQTH